MKNTNKPYRSWGRSRGWRLARQGYESGLPIHIVISTYRRQPHFANKQLGRAIFESATFDPTVLAVCLMPDHLHWLLSTSIGVSRYVGGFKSRTTRQAWHLGIKGKLWQRSFFDRIIRDREELIMAQRYIERNPLEAGLANEASDYPFLKIRKERFPE